MEEREEEFVVRFKMKMFPTFQGGQITPEYRGGLAAVITAGESGRDYGAFVYDSSEDKEFIFITGTFSLNCQPLRVYRDIDQDTADFVARHSRAIRRDTEQEDLKNLDKKIVLPYFLS